MTADDALVAVMATMDAAAMPYMIAVSQLPTGLAFERQGAFEGVAGTIRQVITVAQSPFVCELFELGDDPHDRARFARRASVQVMARRRCPSSIKRQP